MIIKIQFLLKPKIRYNPNIYNKDCIYSLFKNSPLVLYNVQEEKFNLKVKIFQMMN